MATSADARRTIPPDDLMACLPFRAAPAGALLLAPRTATCRRPVAAPPSVLRCRTELSPARVQGFMLHQLPHRRRALIANANRKKAGAPPLSPREPVRVFQAALDEYHRRQQT